MKIDRQIVDDFLGGSTDLDSWIFSKSTARSDPDHRCDPYLE